MPVDKTMSPALIILIENDPNLRHSIALILQRAGYSVTTTDRVNEAFELIQSGNYRLLISDINIPDTKNVLLPKVRHVFPDLPIVILTDQSSAEIEYERMQFSAQYLVKPVAPERLLDSIGSILGRKNSSNHHSDPLQPTDRI